jgi:hypothetical protein
MTIARIGPAKFEHQYRVTAWLALRYFDRATDLRVEPDGEEDLSISFSNDSEYLEVQVKGSENEVDIADVCQWLFHFPHQQADGCLLERLDQRNRSVAFVVGGRCNDSIKDLVVDETHSVPWACERRIERRTVTAFVGALMRVARNWPPKGGLWRSRKAAALRLATNLGADEAERILGRISVVEGMTTARLEWLAPMFMAKELRIPPATAWPVLNGALRREIELARDSRRNALPGIRVTVSAWAVRTVQPAPGYETRSDFEGIARDRLLTTGVLLLCGAAFSGKTDLARALTLERQVLGEHCREFSEVDETARWLQSPVAEDRLAVLHDPFGAHHLRSDAPDRLHLLRDVTSSLSSGRRLVVTSRTDILRQLPAGTGDLREGESWIDVTLTDRELATRIWRSCAGEQPPQAIAHVAEVLRTSPLENLFQPGHLRRLATLRDLTRMDREALRAAADEPARELGSSLAVDSSMSSVLYALRLASSTITPVCDRTLAYILNGSDAGQGCRIDKVRIVVLGAYSDDPIDFPELKGEYTLTSDQENALNALERRGLIRAVEGGALFSHPRYEIAADAAGAATPGRVSARFDGMTARAIGGLDPAAARQAVAILARRCGHGSRLEDSVFLQLLRGCSSVFPTVADRSLVVLLSRYECMTEQEKARVLEAASSLRDLASAIVWRGQTAWFDQGDRSAYMTRLHRVFLEPWGEKCQILLDENPLLSEEDVLLLLDSPHFWTLSPVQQGRLFQLGQASEVALIRAEVATKAATLAATVPERILRAAFAEQHPLVTAGAVQGLLISWDSLTETRRAEFYASITQVIGPAQAAAILQDVLLTYEHAEVPAKSGSASWELWCRLAAIGLRHIPVETLNTGRLYGFAEDAIPFATVEAVTALLEAWTDWLTRYAKTKWPDDHALGVLSLVPAGLRTLRLKIATTLLRQRDTLIRASVCRDLVDSWDEIDDSARGVLMACMADDSPDGRWLRAVALTRRHVPEAVAQMLLPKGTSMTQTAEEFVASCPANVLSDALSVYCGHPQPLWWLGTHHCNRDFWGGVLVFLVGTPEHPAFRLALREAVSSHDDRLQNAAVASCASFREEVLLVLADELTRWSVRITHHDAGKVWNTVLGRARELGLLDRVATEVLRFIEGIEHRGNLSDLLGDDEFGEMLFAGLRSDGVVLRMRKRMDPVPDSSELRERMIKAIRDTYECAPPRLMQTHKASLSLLADVQGPHEVVERVEKAREVDLATVEAQEKTCDDHYDLEDWLSIPPN